MSVEVEVGGVYEKAADLTPPGTIVAFGGTVAPSGWYLCDGTTKNRITDQRLFDVIGTNFGNGDDSGNTFSLPDLRGVFLRGIDNRVTGSKDPDAADRRNLYNETEIVGSVVGSLQGHAFETHNHSHAHNVYTDAGGTGYTVCHSIYNDALSNEGALTTTAAASPTSGNYRSETRPVNIGVNYIIKN